MSRRRRAKRAKRKSLIGLRPKLVVSLVLVMVIAWVGVTAYRGYQAIDQLTPPNGHDFITLPDLTTYTFLVVNQGQQPAQLDELAIAQINFADESLTTLRLPTQLSDGRTSIGQYIESRYYKEAQIAVEQQIALPINGYLIHTRQSEELTGVELSDIVTGQQSLNAWDASVGLPFLLEGAVPVSTNISTQQLWRMLWIASKSTQEYTTTVPPTALQVSQAKATLDPAQIDPMVQELFSLDRVQEQQTSVVVKNGTSVPGMATQMGRMVANLGGEVVAVEPANTSHEDSSLTTDQSSAMATNLSQYLGIPVDQSQKTGRERSDIELVIGVDALTRLGQ